MTLADADAQRARWARHRSTFRLTGDADGFALGGLGRLMGNLNARLVVLPSDPLSDPVNLDAELVAWLKQTRLVPFGTGGAYQWDQTRVTSDAVVRFSSHNEGEWNRYLAVHRHGGVELALSDASGLRRDDKPTVFYLRHTVAHLWDALHLQEQLLTEHTVVGPFEVVLGLPDTAGSVLGHVAQGWAEPSDFMHRPSTCLEDHVLIRLEFAELPPAKEIAMVLAERIDNAWGSTSKRFLARQGEQEGHFDTRGLP